MMDELRSLQTQRYPLEQALTPLGMAVTATTLAMIDDDLAGIARDGHAIGWDIVCKPGCAACCTFVVGATIQEAALVAGSVQAMPKAARQGVVARLVAWERQWTLTNGTGALTTPGQALAWQVKRIVCPMLDPVSYTCLVYERRPIACRTHHACAWPAEVRARTCCEVETPGDGCFSVQANIDHGHNADVWQLDLGLLIKWSDALQEALLMRPDTGYPEVGHLPTLVLRIGRALYRWQNPPKSVKLPVLQHSEPRRGR